MSALNFHPVYVVDVELAEELPALRPGSGTNGVEYRQALALVRLHGVPLGFASVDLEEEGCLSPVRLAEALWRSLSSEINTHLAADGLPPVVMLDASGIRSAHPYRCETDRATFLEDPPFLSVVIPTRERPKVLQRCLDSILAASYPKARLEIVVVDNAPRNDVTRACVEEYAREHPVRYAREDRSGSASARNRGLCASEAPLVLFTDDDVQVDRSWLADTARAFSLADDVGAVTGLVVSPELETQAQVWFEQYGGFTVGGTRRRLYDLGDNRPPNDPLFPYAAGIYGTGGNMSFRRDMIVGLGGFDPALGNGTPARGGVDSEMLLRTVLSGHTLVFEPGSLVFHRSWPEYERLRRQVYNYGVGLGAYLLRTVQHRPSSIPDLIARVPAGLRYALAGSSRKNVRKQSDYPGELNRLELLGLAYSPLAYARSRLRHGRHIAPLPCGDDR